MECYECTEAQRVLKIKEFADDYISVPELNTISSRGWINKTVHVIDSSTGIVVDYNALIRLPEYDSDSYIDITVSSQPTSFDVHKKIASGMRSIEALNKNAGNFNMPKNIIPSAWHFVNCSNCENKLSDFVSNSLRAEIETAAIAWSNIAKALGITAHKVPDSFRLKLESGGFVQFKLLNHPNTFPFELKKS